ncbi:MAG: SGNH/GDSL hydrolase family protein [Candidatus Eisenbacteria bacterium]
MAHPNAERHRLVRIVFAAELVLFLGAVLAYRFFGHRIVEDAYGQRSFGVLNHAFEGRDSAPVGLYLALTDQLVANLTAYALLFLAAQVVFFLLWRSSRKRRLQADGQVGRDVPRRTDADGRDGERRSWNHTGRADVADTSTDEGSAPEPPPLSRAKRIVFTSIVLLLPILVVTIPYAWRYADYMRHLEKPAGLEDGTYVPPAMPGLTPEQLLQVGKAHKEDAPNHSYLRHAADKAEGTVRIGVFGGSFTLGEEAALEHDVSTHLERLLEEAGVGEVEVVNFGVSGFGMSQAALLWEYIGKRYELDYVIFMPLFFHLRRDNSFLHTDHHYGPIHGLYVTEGDTARYVPIVGNDRLDSCRRYFSPFQPLRYWRYDTRVPMLFRPLMPSPLGRRGNPFYYQDDEDAGTVEMYRALFRKIASECGQLIVFTDPTLRPRLEGIQSEATRSEGRQSEGTRSEGGRRKGTHGGGAQGGQIHLMETRLDDFRDASSSLYRAPLDHPSGIGYEVYATEMAHLLLGRERPTYRILEVGDRIPAAQVADTLSELGGLSAMTNVKLAVEGSPVGEFRRRANGAPGRWGRVGHAVDFREEGIRSIAAYLGEDTRVFVPLPFPLHAGESIDVVWQNAGGTTRVPIGEVTTGAGLVGQLDVDWTKLDGRSATDGSRTADGITAANGGSSPASWYGRIDEDDEFGVIEMMSDQDLGGFHLEIGGKVALVGEPRELGRSLLSRPVRALLLGHPWTRSQIRLRPVVSGLLYFRGVLGDYVDVASLEHEEGMVDLRFTGPEGEIHEIPLLPYRVKTVPGPRYEPRYGAAVSTR